MRKTVFMFMTLVQLTLFTLLPVAYPQQLDIKLISLTSPVRHGSNAAIAVSTVASANCQITVRYMSGPSRAQGLFPNSADSQGRANWTWRVGSNTTPGSWPIIVTCSSGGQSGTLKTSFVVR